MPVRHAVAMRSADAARLESAYTEEELELENPEIRLAARLGVSTPAARGLTAALFADLDIERFGVSWWPADAVPKRHSIVLGDHLHLAAGALSDCLIEAKLHQLELEECWERQERRHSQHLASGGDVHKFPPPVEPADELPHILDTLHLAGFFRAVAQVLDCLAVVIIGVGDLPMNMHTAQWQWIFSRVADGKHDRTPFEDEVRDLLAASGPAGWIEWTVAMRNMLVHRPRLLGMNTIGVIAAELDVPGMSRFDRIHITKLLPRTPRGSVIESLVASGALGASLLTEDGAITVERVNRATRDLAEKVADAAGDEWARRRGAGLVQRHFENQWPTIGTHVMEFEGFAPGSSRVDPDLMMVHGSTGRRMMAAALMNGARDQIWGEQGQ